MQHVTLDKARLLKIVRDNRKQHLVEFNDSYRGWLDQVEEKIGATMSGVRAAKERYAEAGTADFRTPYFRGLEEPESFVKEYDRAIRMLELSIDERIVITQEEFANLVQDEWRWTETFKSKVAVYSRRRAS